MVNKFSFSDSRMIKSFDFTNPISVGKDNGVITGTPTFSKRGIDLNGTTDYITYAISNTLFASAKISIVVEFTPAFNFDADAQYQIFDATIGHRYSIAIRDNLNNNALFLQIGNIVLIQIASAVYSPYWKQNERNVFVFSGTSGDNNLWLNGTQILTNNLEAWEVKYPTELYVGERFNTGVPFDGEIHSLSIYNNLLSGDDAQALYDNSLFNFKNKANVWLDMKSQSSDGTNQITKDKSSKGNDFKLGDGTTAGTFPAFSNPGFDFDGSSDYLLNSSTSEVYNNASQSIVMCFKPNFTSNANADYYLFDSTNSTEYSIVKEDNGASDVLTLTLGNTTIASISNATFKPLWNAHGLNVISIAGTTGNTDVWLNGFKILSADNTAWSAANPSDIILGAEQAIGNYFDGEIFHFSTYAQKLTPIQVRTITNDLMREYSQ